jgi:hypothetical protein
VHFSDPEACSVDFVSWRCEPADIEDLPYGDPCESEPATIYTNWKAIDSEASLIKVLGYPVPPSEPDDYYQPCVFEHVTPLPTSPLCNCTDAACAAQ